MVWLEAFDTTNRALAQNGTRPLSLQAYFCDIFWALALPVRTRCHSISKWWCDNNLKSRIIQISHEANDVRVPTPDAIAGWRFGGFLTTTIALHATYLFGWAGGRWARRFWHEKATCRLIHGIEFELIKFTAWMRCTRWEALFTWQPLKCSLTAPEPDARIHDLILVERESKCDHKNVIYLIFGDERAGERTVAESHRDNGRWKREINNEVDI